MGLPGCVGGATRVCGWSYQGVWVELPGCVGGDMGHVGK